LESSPKGAWKTGNSLFPFLLISGYRMDNDMTVVVASIFQSRGNLDKEELMKVK
jgi:hypothetical protein